MCEYHCITIERVCRYLKGITNYDIHYTCFPVVIEVFSDANWISDSHETKSISGYVFTLVGGTISWKFAKQTIISCSTMEVEIITLPIMKVLLVRLSFLKICYVICLCWIAYTSNSNALW